MLTSKFISSLIGAATVCLSACQLPLNNAACPCASGWSCCSSTNICVASASECSPGRDSSAEGGGSEPCTPGKRCEAENAAYTVFAFANSASGYSGTGYLSCADDPATTPNPCAATFNVDVPSAGTYNLVIGYASPLSQLDRGIAVTIDTVPVTSTPFLAFAPTSGGFATHTLSVQLVAGRNEVVIGPSSGSYSLDYIEVQATQTGA
jgi:hypothetical protein